MGSGASFETTTGNDDSTRYFCHSCRYVFDLNSPFNARVVHTCPRCHSSFLEEFGGDRSSYMGNFRHHSELNEEQSRRLANAAIMLRLLEAQLRDELENLQFQYAASRQEQQKPAPMSTLMLDKLRQPKLSVDMMCSQPSCPICSEEFVENSTAVALPCSHFFHNDCVMTWLDAKRTCPICRYELTDQLPTIEELERFSNDELEEKLLKFSSKMESSTGSSKREKAMILLQCMKHEQEKSSSDGGSDNDRFSGLNEEEQEEWRLALEEERQIDEARMRQQLLLRSGQYPQRLEGLRHDDHSTHENDTTRESDNRLEFSLLSGPTSTYRIRSNSNGTSYSAFPLTPGGSTFQR